MEVRADDGNGPLLFKWDSDTSTVDLVRKNMYYKIQLAKHAYCVMEEHPKYDCSKSKSHEN